MQIILLVCFNLFKNANMDIIATGGISIFLLSLMPSQSRSFPLDTLEDDAGLLPTSLPPQTTSFYQYGPTRVPNWENRLRRCYKMCRDITDISDALVNEFRSGLWKTQPLIQDWALCVLHKMDLMTLQGVFRYDTARDFIQRDVGYNAEEAKKASAIIDKCLTHKLLTPAHIAWEYLQCHRRKDTKRKYPSLGILLDSDLRRKKKVVVFYEKPEEIAD